jgi:hypothetical protein
MKNKDLINSVLYAVAFAMGISIVILSFFMSFTCEYNLRAFFIMVSIAVICLALAGINNIKKK